MHADDLRARIKRNEFVGQRRAFDGNHGASGGAGEEAFLDFLAVEVAADQHEAAVALFALFPVALVISVEHHVHALDDETLRIVPEGENTLEPQDFWPFIGGKLVHPWKKLIGIERLFRFQRNRLHLLVMIVLQTAMMVMVPGMVTMMVVPVIMLVLFEERGLDFENALQVERALAKEQLDLHVTPLRAINLGVRMDRADAAFNVFQLIR